MRKIGLTSVIAVASVVLVSLLFYSSAEAEVTLPRCAVIIVSDFNEFDENEIEKADSFYQYLVDEGYENDDIQYLTRSSMDNCDGVPNVTNIQSAFNWLADTSSSSSQPVIYIQDHEKYILGNVTFQFSDGNITANTMDSWFDEMEYQEMTVVLNGNRSAMAGSDLSGLDRDIICSMGPTQSFQIDQFNITRSLEDTNADFNFDGEVSYVEAFWKERLNLFFNIQNPQIY